jgi:hypothetical protein
MQRSANTDIEHFAGLLWLWARLSHPWTPEDEVRLRISVAAGRSVANIAEIFYLKRTKAAMGSKAQRLIIA